MKLYESLCIYDSRSPYFFEDDTTDFVSPRRKNCACDLCFYGRDKLAIIALELFEALSEALVDLELARMNEKDDEIRGTQKQTILKARAAIVKAKGE